MGTEAGMWWDVSTKRLGGEGWWMSRDRALVNEEGLVGARDSGKGGHEGDLASMDVVAALDVGPRQWEG